jgi:uncharacterized protein with PQ loop repeat
MTSGVLQLLAGSVASLIFALGALPMLLKARRTRDMRSYSLSYLLLMNAGNLVYWAYVLSLPLGPIWFMHTFWSATMLIMLIWYVRYRDCPC